MAFRKSVRSSYFPPVSLHGFGETKYSPSSSGESSKFYSRSFIDCGELSDTALPLVSLDTIVSTGQPINGHVSFSSSDPAVIESNVHNGLATFISDSQSNSSNSSSDEN
nr:unnamed protein product [uncultured bacterium]